MPKYVIERELPGAGSLDDDQRRHQPEEQRRARRARRRCAVASQLRTDDKLFCVYIAPHEALIPEHAARGGFPADAVHQVARTIDPTTGGS